MWAADPASFDLSDLDDRFLDYPFPTYVRLREESPIHRNPDGSFLVTCYDEVAAVLNGRVMSSDKKAPLRPRRASDSFVADGGCAELVDEVRERLGFKEHELVRAVGENLDRYRAANALGGRLLPGGEGLAGASPAASCAAVQHRLARRGFYRPTGCGRSRIRASAQRADQQFRVGEYAM